MNKFLVSLMAFILISLIPCIAADIQDEKVLQLENWKEIINAKANEISHLKELSTIICGTIEEDLKVLTKAKEEKKVENSSIKV